MDGLLKGLIGTACSVVIAAGAYFAVSEYRDYTARKSAAEALMREAMKGPCEEATKEAFMMHLLPSAGHPALARLLHECDAAGLMDADLKEALERDGPLAKEFQRG